jgi:hypothetical protein
MNTKRTVAKDSTAKKLFITAAATTGSGAFWAWTVLRSTNGALSIRADRLVGPGNGSIALTYSRNESWSKQAEEKYTSKELLATWSNLNCYRALILMVGTAIGAFGLAIEAYV